MNKKAILYQIEFEPIGLRGECPAGKSLLDCARRLGVGLASICGGSGKCRACKVQVLKGNTSAITTVEKETFTPQALAAGWRLACLAKPQSDCLLHVPPESMTTMQRMQVEGQAVAITPEPVVSAYNIALAAPTLSDLQADDARLIEALKKQHNVDCRSINIGVLREMSAHLRTWNWQAGVAVHGSEIVALNPVSSLHLGMAVDVGTTKIAGYLIDLESGKTLASKGVMNPQISYGEDITSRMTNALKSAEEAAHLQEVVISAVDGLAHDLCHQAGAEVQQIVDAVIVGNTAMHHLLLGLLVKPLAYAPFVAVVQDALDIKAHDTGLHFAPGAYVHLLPNIAGFVGADHVSMLLAIDALKIKDATIAIDIGTNTEISLIHSGAISSVSCASGPAFEGGHIKYGMRAAGGAIERLRIDGEAITYQTIDNQPPVGICGSGILDALAQLYLNGVLDEGGKLLKKSRPRLQTSAGQSEFILVTEAERQGQPAITITQHDIRELQLAKAAIRAGIQVLLESRGISEKKVKQVIIAGAFGTYIDVSSAIATGMLPSLPLNRFHQVGNAAGLGAKMALLSQTKRQEAQAIAAKMQYIELATAPGFTQTFIQASYLGAFTLKKGKKVV